MTNRHLELLYDTGWLQSALNHETPSDSALPRNLMLQHRELSDWELASGRCQEYNVMMCWTLRSLCPPERCLYTMHCGLHGGSTLAASVKRKYNVMSLQCSPSAGLQRSELSAPACGPQELRIHDEMK